MRKNAIITLLIVVFMFALTATSFAAPDDSTLSQHIKEADGTSGQDTNTGSGVKTGHIQNNAVTTPKIADGAVTDAKITGPISAAKISSLGLDADTVDGVHASDFAPVLHSHNQTDVNGLTSALSEKADVIHNHDSLYQKKYGGVAVVATSGGDYTNPRDALLNGAEWCASTPCLLKIMPGTYNISSYLYVGGGIVIEGSGKGTTKIVASWEPVILLVGDSEVKDITLENNGTGSEIEVVDIAYSAARLTNVDLVTSSTSTDAVALRVWNYGHPILKSVNIYTAGIGIKQFGCAGLGMELNDVKIMPNEGAGVMVEAIDANCSSENIAIRNSEIYGSVVNNGAHILVVNSLLGGALSGPGIFKLVNNYDADYNVIPNQ